MEFWCWPGWLWWCASVMSRCVGAAVVTRRWLAPWALWLGTRTLCWCRYAAWLYRQWRRRRRRRRRQRGSGTRESDRRRGGLDSSTCRCCDGVDFDGMAGAWAVVTGCTDGIGKEYALQLAERGLNVALVSRNPNKLQAVAQEIHERHRGRIETRVVTADLTSSAAPLADTYDAVRRGLAGLDVKLLVNNAGLGYGRPEALLDLPPCCARAPDADRGDPCRDVVECNALAAVAMCRAVMPLMLRHRGDAVGCDGYRDGGATGDRYDDDHRYDDDDDGARPPLWPSPPPPSPASSLSTVRGGVVINVSSASALLPCPLLSVYAATKAFLNKFSSELAAEYDLTKVGEQQQQQQQPSIAVRCLTPGFVATKLSRIRVGTKGDTGWTYVPSPGSYARYSLRSLGCHCACRKFRGRHRSRKPETGNGRKSDGSAGKEAGHGWLAGVISAVFVSPSSPFSVGQAGIVTTGYPSHTLMVLIMNAARWLIGDAYVYSAVNRLMRRARDRIMQREELKSTSAATEVVGNK